MLAQMMWGVGFIRKKLVRDGNCVRWGIPTYEMLCSHNQPHGE